MNRSIKLLQLDDIILKKLEDQHIYQVNHLINLDYEKGGFSKAEEKVIVDAFEGYKVEELIKELRGRVNYFPLEYLDEKYSFGKLGLSFRAFNGLSRNQITSISEIIKQIINFQIYELDYLGATSIAQIMEIVQNIVTTEKLEKYLPIYQLRHRYDAITLPEMGFFSQMIDKLSSLGFDTLGKLRFGYLNGKLGNLFNYKTMQSFTKKLSEYFSFIADNNFYFFQLYLVENRFGKATWDEIMKIMETDNPEHLVQLKKRLIGCCEIVLDDEGVRLPYFIEKIKKTNLKKESIAIVIARFEGLTLQKVASQFHKTRERIRQIVRDRMAQISLFYEKALVKEYNKFIWHPEVFKRVYEINEFSLNVVKYLGNKINYDAKYEFPEEYIQSLFDQQKIKPFALSEFHQYFPKIFVPKITIYGKNYDIMTRRQFLEFVIEHFIPKRGMHKSKIIQKANQIAIENQLDFNYDKFIDVVSNTIQGLRYSRFYDYSLITPVVKERLAKIFEEVNSVYSCTYFYRKHFEFLKTIDIHDGYELHFLLRKLFFDDEKYKTRIDFNRQPMIGPVGMTFADFIRQSWEVLNEPTDLDDFIDQLLNKHGFHSGTLVNIINQTLGDYICYHTIFNKEPMLSKDTKEKIKHLLVDEFYELEELTNIFQEHGIKQNDYQYFSNFWLNEFGYKTHDINYVIKKPYASLKELFFKKVLPYEIYDISPKDRNMRETTLILFVETLRLSYLMFPLGNVRLISMKALEKQGVTEQSLRNYVATLQEYLKNEEYFTYESLLKEKYYLHHPDFQIVEDYHLERDIIISLIRNVKGIKKTTKGDLFKISSEPPIINDFLDELQSKYQFSNLEQLRAFVWENYGLVIKKHDL
ncbi:MAG: hypothetical protein AB7V00_03780 [Bacilli bacterium]